MFNKGNNNAGIPNPRPQGAVTSSIRPQPRPGSIPAQPSFIDRLRGMVPEKGTQAHHDMIMGLVQAGMGSAAQSTSPLAALLTPMAGALISGNSTKARQEVAAKENEALVSAALGDKASNPEVQRYLDVLGNENAPAHLRSIAQSNLDKILNPPVARSSGGGRRRSSGGRRRSSGGGGSSSGGRTRLYGEYTIDGVVHGRNAYGQMVPYTRPDGQPLKAETDDDVSELVGLTTPAQPETPEPVSAPVMPESPPLASNSALDENDPLGILGTPPA